MRKTRFMSLLFLVWSIAFFFVPEFRQALQVLVFSTALEADWEMASRMAALPRPTLQELARSAEQQRDARTLAFLAMHPPDGGEQGLRLANQAVALDPQFTWIYSAIYSKLDFDEPGNHEMRQQALERLKAWDPDNAFPYLLEGTEVVAQRRGNFPAPHRLDELAKETAWRQVMAKAFAAPRYDSYASRRFELERVWLRQHHLDKPGIVLWSVSSYPIPNLLNIRMYGNLLVKKLGREAEDAGRMPEALGYYWTVSHMAGRMQLQGAALIEKLIGAALQMDAYERLVPLLRRTGRTDEAVTLEYALRQTRQNLESARGSDPLTQSSNYGWAALMVAFFTGLVWAFGLFTVLCVIYVNAKRWVRPEKKGRLYQLLTVAENYMPILLFLACLGLYLSYYPYAQNFHHYMTASGEIHNFEPLFYNVIPNYGGPPGGFGLPLGNPFRPYAWYAIVGLVLVLLASIPLRRRG